MSFSESSSSSCSGPTGFIFLSKSACIDNGKNSGSFTSARLVSLGASASQLDLGEMSEEELVVRIQSLTIENDELRGVLQHNNGLLENHFKELANMQETQKQRSEHLTKAHEKAKDVVKKLRGKNRGLEKNLKEAHDRLAELEMQISLKEASTEESGDQEKNKEAKHEPLKEMAVRLKEEKKTLVLQNQLLQEHITKARTISESEELIASVTSSDVWSSSDLISSEYGSAAGKSDSTDSKFDTELEIVKVDLAQVRVENEQKELLLRELRSEKENLEIQFHQRETEIKETNDLLKAAQRQADERCQQLENEKAQIEDKYQQLQADKEQVMEKLQQAQEAFHKVSSSEETCILEMAENQREGADAGLEQRFADLMKQLTEERLKKEHLQTQLDQTKAEKMEYKVQVDSFNARYKEAEENAKAFDLGNEDIMKQKFDALKQQLFWYQKREGENKDKEEALLAREEDLTKLEQDKIALSTKVETLELQLAESRQKETALQDEINVRQQEIDAAQTNLQEQLEVNSRVHAQVDENWADIEALQQQLQEAECRLELEMRIHEEDSEALKQNLQEALDESDRAEHLRAQVCQLIQENHSLEAKIQDLSKEGSDREGYYSQRITMIEQDFQGHCQQKDTVVESLRKQLSAAEDEVRKGKAQQELGRNSYEELLTQHEQVMSEYNTVVLNFQATVKGEKKRKESLSAEIKNLQVQVDNMTAQLVGAEEAIQKKNDEYNEAKERLQDMSRQLEGIGVMRTQLEVYQSDFQAERDAREREHAEVIRLREENQQLQMDLQRTQDELDRHNNAQLTTMQLRHGGNEHRSAPPPMSTGYPAAEPGWFGGFFTRRGPGEEAGIVPGDVAGGEVRGDERRGEQPSEEENCWSCPQCQQRFPDFDSLQIHAVDCTGRQEPQQAAPWCPKCGNFYPDMDTLQIHVIECLDE